MMWPAEPNSPTVLLRHALPDGSSHVDWMLALRTTGDDPLTTFRLDTPLFDFEVGEDCDAVRIGDHRHAYLDYEGPISGGRGSVSRIDRGRATVDSVRGRSARILLRWDQHGDQRIEVTPVARADRWIITFLAAPDVVG